MVCQRRLTRLHRRCSGLGTFPMPGVVGLLEPTLGLLLPDAPAPAALASKLSLLTTRDFFAELFVGLALLGALAIVLVSRL